MFETYSGCLMHRAEGFESYVLETRAPQTYKLRRSSMQAEKFHPLISSTYPLSLALRIGTSVKVFKT
jgi:hypothetical protein